VPGEQLEAQERLTAPGQEAWARLQAWGRQARGQLQVWVQLLAPMELQIRSSLWVQALEQTEQRAQRAWAQPARWMWTSQNRPERKRMRIVTSGCSG